MEEPVVAIPADLCLDLFLSLKNPSATQVYLFIWIHTLGRGQPTGFMSQQAIAEGTGLSKSTVQKSIRVLKELGLIQSQSDSPTAVPEYEILSTQFGNTAQVVQEEPPSEAVPTLETEPSNQAPATAPTAPIFRLPLRPRFSQIRRKAMRR